ncbi:MAG: hypothetical protein ABJC74_05000 [Gemmatimonadota bacterium]
MNDRSKQANRRHTDSKRPHKPDVPDSGQRRRSEETTRPETPELEGVAPLPEELTGRASATAESLTSLFDNRSAGHLKDGFHGGSGDDGPTLDQTDGPGDAEEEDDGA